MLCKAISKGPGVVTPADGSVTNEEKKKKRGWEKKKKVKHIEKHHLCNEMESIAMTTEQQGPRLQ